MNGVFQSRLQHSTVEQGANFTASGYNNIDLKACREKGISVCNVPTYATEAMAHMAITFIMALSCSLVQQAKAYAKNDKSYLNQCHLGPLPHFELTDKRLGLIGGLGTIGLRVAAMARALSALSDRSGRAASLGHIHLVARELADARADSDALHRLLRGERRSDLGRP